jgi:hypothetical protein
MKLHHLLAALCFVLAVFLYGAAAMPGAAKALLLAACVTELAGWKLALRRSRPLQ